MPLFPFRKKESALNFSWGAFSPGVHGKEKEAREKEGREGGLQDEAALLRPELGVLGGGLDGGEPLVLLELVHVPVLLGGLSEVHLAARRKGLEVGHRGGDPPAHARVLHPSLEHLEGLVGRTLVLLHDVGPEHEGGPPLRARGLGGGADAEPRPLGLLARRQRRHRRVPRTRGGQVERGEVSAGHARPLQPRPHLGGLGLAVHKRQAPRHPLLPEAHHPPRGLGVVTGKLRAVHELGRPSRRGAQPKVRSRLARQLKPHDFGLQLALLVCLHIFHYVLVALGGLSLDGLKPFVPG
mmetsp:Transcript_55379/g.125856  ORF Transcript_55379/g.125856 Transcript_55379/m.125856 type:complete len:296 (+) Transcript_55379:169-1056(+)